MKAMFFVCQLGYIALLFLYLIALLKESDPVKEFRLWVKEAFVLL